MPVINRLPSGGVQGLQLDDNGRLTGDVAVPNGVTSIGDYNFYHCTNITSVTLSTTVTSIGISAFKSTTSLKNFTIPLNVTSVGNNAFETAGLETLNIDTTSIITFGSSVFLSGIIKTINVQNGFNPRNFNISQGSNVITKANILDIFNKLATVPPSTVITFGSVLINQLSSVEKAIATNKGWTLA